MLGESLLSRATGDSTDVGSYCASPFSGMGTTLALDGGYNLAGALLRHPDRPKQAFEEYEAEMRPVVTRAQKLFPGMPRIFAPETAWGVWVLNAIVYLIQLSGLPKILFKYLGPPANTVPVKEYGFKTLPEWSPEESEK
jgi:2-polyprenyl-6-methoxyphenol hydroxylase-like FAD-dependent oxidoreductase